MKITRSYLKQVIMEEIQKEVVGVSPDASGTGDDDAPSSKHWDKRGTKSDARKIRKTDFASFLPKMVHAFIVSFTETDPRNFVRAMKAAEGANTTEFENRLVGIHQKHASANANIGTMNEDEEWNIKTNPEYAAAEEIQRAREAFSLAVNAKLSELGKSPIKLSIFKNYLSKLHTSSR